MADPFDALFKVPAPQKRAGVEKRVATVVDGVCQKCKTPGVFWSFPPGPFILCELSNGVTVRHHCIALLDDFEALP